MVAKVKNDQPNTKSTPVGKGNAHTTGTLWGEGKPALFDRLARGGNFKNGASGVDMRSSPVLRHDWTCFFHKNKRIGEAQNHTSGSRGRSLLFVIDTTCLMQ